MIDATSTEELQKKVSPVTVAFIVIILAVGFILGRLSFKLEATDAKFHEEIKELKELVEYYNGRVDRKIKNHEDEYHK